MSATEAVLCSRCDALNRVRAGKQETDEHFGDCPEDTEQIPLIDGRGVAQLVEPEPLKLHDAGSTPAAPAPWGYGCPLHPGDPQAMSGTPGRCLARPASGGKGRYELASQMCGERLVALVAAAPQRPEPVAWLCPSCGFLSLNDASGYESCSYARVEGHIMEPLFTSPPAASREAVACAHPSESQIRCGPGYWCVDCGALWHPNEKTWRLPKGASAAPVQADVAGWLRDRMPSGQQVGKFGHEPGWTKGYVMGLNDAADDWERTHPPASAGPWTARYALVDAAGALERAAKALRKEERAIAARGQAEDDARPALDGGERK